jgi:multiple antibiotic resistance protein
LDWHILFEEFVMVWVVVDPIGNIPIFLAATKGMDQKQRSQVAIQANLAAAGILIFFIVFGQILLEALGISLVSFRIAGGIVLFMFALTMIFGSSKPETANGDGAMADQNVAIFPLAMPAIAGPGAMLAVVVLTDNHRFSIPEQAWTTATMLVVLAISMAILLLANPIYRVIGESGANIVSRVMGMVLAAVAVDAILEGIETRFFLA